MGEDRGRIAVRGTADGGLGARRGCHAGAGYGAGRHPRELLSARISHRLVSPHGPGLSVPYDLSRGTSVGAAASRASTWRSYLPMEGDGAHAGRSPPDVEDHRLPGDQGRQDRAGAIFWRRRRDLDLHLDVGGEVVYLDA